MEAKLRMKTILTKINKLDCESNEQTQVYCYCRKEEHRVMIACENPSCKYEWFHFSCVNLSQEPSVTGFVQTVANYLLFDY